MVCHKFCFFRSGQTRLRHTRKYLVMIRDQFLYFSFFYCAKLPISTQITNWNNKQRTEHFRVEKNLRKVNKCLPNEAFVYWFLNDEKCSIYKYKSFLKAALNDHCSTLITTSSRGWQCIIKRAFNCVKRWLEILQDGIGEALETFSWISFHFCSLTQIEVFLAHSKFFPQTISLQIKIISKKSKNASNACFRNLWY